MAKNTEKLYQLIRGFWQRPDVLSKYPKLELEQLVAQRDSKLRNLDRTHWEPLINCVEGISNELLESHVGGAETRGGVVSLGDELESSPQLRELIAAAIEILTPWRKGPFSIFGEAIDSEWRSDKKWERVVRHLDAVEGKRIADVGCGNGYAMMRLAESHPECVIGFEPGEIAIMQFEFLQLFLRNESLQIEPLKDPALTSFDGFFDIILCKGVLYHHKNPLGLLRHLRSALAPGGQLLIESQTYPMKGPFAFFNEDRYAKAHNVFFVPTSDCLAGMIAKCGFRNIRLCSEDEITNEEQRTSKHMRFESLADFLDPNDAKYTIEGHRTPTRSILTARVPEQR